MFTIIYNLKSNLYNDLITTKMSLKHHNYDHVTKLVQPPHPAELFQTGPV